MTNNMPSGMKKHCESTKPENIQMAKMFSFFFLDGLVQNCVTLSRQLMHKTVAFTPSSAPAHHFYVTFK